MEATATVKYARVSPRKARRVIDLIKGKMAEQALTDLRFMPYGAAPVIEKLLKSAVANAEQKEADIEKLRISDVFVNCGSVMKRTMPRSMGRANIIRKRTSHITLVVREEE